MGFEIKTKNVHLKFGATDVVKDVEVKTEVKNTSVKIPKKDFTYAPLRTLILPTPAQLREAVIAVDRDPRPLMDILRRLPEADPHIFSVGNTRQLAILGYDWKVEPFTKDNDKEKARCEEIENALERTNFDQFLTSLTNGIVFGHSVTNPVWHLDAKNRYYPKFDFLEGIHFGKKDGRVKMIVDKNDKDFLVTIGSNAEITGINNQYQIATALSGSGNIIWMDLNEDDLIIVNSIPPILQGWKNNYVGGLMRPGLYLTLLKYFTLLDWAKFNELFGMPVRVGKFDPVLTSDEGIAILKTAIQNLGTDAGAVIDKTTEMDFLRAESGIGTGKATYEGFAEYVERKQSLVFIGQNLTAEQTGKFGSNALGQTQNLIRMDYMWADLQLVEANVQKIIQKMYFFNYGNPPEGFYPKFKFYTEETKDLEQLSSVLDNLTRSGLPISKKWAYKTFDVDEPEDEKDSFGTNNPSPFNIGD
jgi:phage gp29-like protein